MADKQDNYDMSENFASPFLPRGRGVLGAWHNVSMGRGSVSARAGYNTQLTDSGRGTGPSQHLGGDPVQLTGGLPFTSTPECVDAAAINHLTNMVGQLGTQIGDSIVSKLLTAGVVNVGSHESPGPSHYTSSMHSGHNSNCTSQGSSNITVHVKSDKEPKLFRGDGSDEHKIQDWIDVTKAYLRRQRCPVGEQAEEIMGRLIGKARDVVKVALRSDATLDVRQRPDLIYDILLQYFSDTSSCLPLADFYTTLPRPDEGPVDYWLRVNRAADLADEGLRRQGRCMENLGDEVARMFVKHCPDPELSSVFKCKPIYEWSAREIQLRIDDHQREQRSTAGEHRVSRLKCHSTSVPVSDNQTTSVQCCTQCPHLTPVPVGAANDTQGRSGKCQNNVSCSPSEILPFSPTPAVAQNAQETEDRVLNRMMTMLEQMMNRVQQRNSTPRGGRFQASSREVKCRVCGNDKHTTVSHCMLDRLCFTCLSPGHMREHCPSRSSPSPKPMGN